MSVLTAILLGVIQGITEFLPVSSSGHLVLLETLSGFDAESPELLLFDLAVHVGTLVSIFIVFRRSLPGLMSPGKAAVGGLTDSGDALRPVHKGRLFLMIIIATVVTGAFVMPFKDQFMQARGSLMVVAFMWLITGTLLWITDSKKVGGFDLEEFGLRGAVLIGLAQGVAVMPGISRSGMTVCVAILLGLHRTRAVEFSLLIGIPAILGAALVEGISEREALLSGSLPLWCPLLGAAVAAVIGVGAIKLLLRVSQAAQLRYFGFYCYALAAMVFGYLLIR